jgi:hypothetical protein
MQSAIVTPLAKSFSLYQRKPPALATPGRRGTAGTAALTTGTALLHLASVALEAGKSYPIELDWFNSPGFGEIHLSWPSASRAKQIVPKERLTPAP